MPVGYLYGLETLVADIAIIVSTLMFTVYFRLQKIGGPTYLSQISYIASAVALVSGTVFLSERYSLLTWLGALIIVVAILLGVKAQGNSSPGK